MTELSGLTERTELTEPNEPNGSPPGAAGTSGPQGLPGRGAVPCGHAADEARRCQDVAEEQRAMMRGFPTGVAVLTALGRDGAPLGMTISSLCSVSLSPPTLLVCLRAASPTLEAVLAGGHFAVNLLADGAREVAELFASGRPDRFDHVRWEHGGEGRTATGPHLVRDAHAVADCRVSRTDHVADHVVVYGETLRVTRDPAGPPPLVHGMRQYRRWPAL